MAYFQPLTVDECDQMPSSSLATTLHSQITFYGSAPWGVSRVSANRRVSANCPQPGNARRFGSQRDVQRALRAVKSEKENRTVRITRDGALELVPVGKSAEVASPDSSWDDLKGAQK
jgi:hypothetical protein